MADKPNIIFFFSDQQRWDTVGCYGQKLGQKLDLTPNLDRMAAEGVCFRNAFTCQPVCGPARACIQTGKYATETGCFRNGIALPLEEKTIAHWFSETGYDTAYVGKWHLASTVEIHDFMTKPIPPERRGGYQNFWMASDVLEFTSHGYNGYVYDKDMNKVDFHGYRADCITDFALEYLNGRKYDDKPFFLFISHIEPHHQNDRNRFEGPEGSKDRFTGYEVPEDLEGTGGDWKESLPDYLGCCSSLDYNLGRLRAELVKLGFDDNTVIFYTSDHGCHFRTRNEEYKRSCHESAIRIPMIAYGPGFRGGRDINELVSLMDIPPTLLASAGIEKPAEMRGRPLQTLVEGRALGWPEEIFVQISESHVGRAIRTKKWKYSVKAPEMNGWDNSGSDVYFDDCLYDLENDYHEKRNLISDPAFEDIRKQLGQILKQRMADAGESVPEIYPL